MTSNNGFTRPTSLRWIAALVLTLWYVSTLTQTRNRTHRSVLEVLSEERKKKLYGSVFKTNHVAGVVHNVTMMPKGLRLVMVGDSQMRFQYLSLVYFLRHHQFFDPNYRYGHLTNAKSGFKDWGEFFSITNGWLYPLEHCDCWRSDPVHESSVENRYFYDKRNDNMVVYHQAFGHHAPLRGRWTVDQINHKMLHEAPPKPLRVQNATVDDMVCNETHWHNVVRDYIAKYDPKPTHVLLNAGLWKNNFSRDPQERVQLLKALEDSALVGIWKTNTYTNKHEVFRRGTVNDNLFCRDLQQCLDVSWTQKLDARNYADKNHFWEPINRAMNEDLLTMLGYQFPPYYRKVPKEQYYEASAAVSR